MVCFYGNDCGGKSVDQLSDSEFENLVTIISILEIPIYLYPCKCNAADTYQEYSRYIPHIPFFRKYQEKIKALIEYQERTFNFEDFTIDSIGDKIELFWNWEDYNGLYNTSGTMKAIYHHESGDDTWAKSETRCLIKNFNLKYKSINSFEEFLDAIDIKILTDDNN